MNTLSVFDSVLYAPLFTQPEMQKIWSDKHLISCWLTFEKTIAQVQAELGIIPTEAVPAILSACDTLIIDWTKMSADTASVGMAIKPLIDQITANGDQLVKKYLHWGCTTQDLLDTSLAMRLKESLILIRQQLIDLGNILQQQAHFHQKTVMVARTNAIDASATTWGLQLSSYLNEISRHILRLDSLYSRAIVGMYGGAVGNLASTGSTGIIVRKMLCERLGLTEPVGIHNASLDHIVEVVQFFALIHGSLGRIANDIELMCRTSIFEAEEGKKGGGSSTMPHKTNPRLCNMLQTLSRMGWMYASGAPNMQDQQDVRAASMRMLTWTIIPEATLTVSVALNKAKTLFEHLIIHTDNMKRNFEASRYFIMSEAVMMALADKIGRQNAYQLMKETLKEADNSLSIFHILSTNNEVLAVLSLEELQNACDPSNYLGCNDALIEESCQFFKQCQY